MGQVEKTNPNATILPISFFTPRSLKGLSFKVAAFFIMEFGISHHFLLRK